MKQISAIERLRSLPSIFRGADLTIRFGWKSKTASHYLYLWRQRGLVEPLGGHSDVFANLLFPAPPDWNVALRLAMPSALLIGIEALRQAGWTTQVPHLPTVAVDASQPVFSTERFDISRRTPAWCAAVRRGVTPVSDDRLPVLTPAWALADLLQTQGWGACGLTPDDIDWSLVTPRDERQWELAAKALGLAASPLLDDAVGGRDRGAPTARMC